MWFAHYETHSCGFKLYVCRQITPGLKRFSIKHRMHQNSNTGIKRLHMYELSLNVGLKTCHAPIVCMPFRRQRRVLRVVLSVQED